MKNCSVRRIVTAALFAAAAFANAQAQNDGATAPHSTTTGNFAHRHDDWLRVPGCAPIANACKAAGFYDGGAAKHEGLYLDCFERIVHRKGSVTKAGKPVSIPVSESDINSCHAGIMNGHH